MCLRLLAGLDRGAGAVDVLGECWQDDARGIFVPVHRRAVGFVFQHHTLLSHLSVAHNLDYAAARARGRPRIERDLIIAILAIEPLLGRRPAGLSGGERQRVAIAQALLAQPKLLLVDEPLAALDQARKLEILPLIERVRDELSTPIVYVSHSIDEIARLADHLVILDSGKVVGAGPLGATLSRLDLPTAMGDDAGVVIDARVDAHDAPNHLTRLAFPGGSLWVTGIGRAVGATVRARALARDVSVALEMPGPSSILNVLPARVVEVSDLEPDRVLVRMMLGGGPVALIARITRRSKEALGVRPGLAVVAQIKSVALVTAP
jgi:molybdate transport system ATP-binding protein